MSAPQPLTGDELAAIKEPAMSETATVAATTDPSPVGWWITDEFFANGGRRIMGPFASRDLALDVRALRETVEGHHRYFVDEIAAAEVSRTSGDDHGPLTELFGVMRRDGGSPFGPPGRERCEAMIAEDPSLVLVHYYSSAWVEAAS